MNHPHLLPDEIDRLLDDDVADPSPPAWQRHLEECAECRARVAEEQEVLALIANVPRFAPSHRFADRVMSEVPVFVPWYVTAADTLRQYTPVSRQARLAALALAGTAGSLFTAAIAWAALRPDVVLFAIELVESRVRASLLRTGSSLALSLFGDRAATVVSQSGAVGIVAIGTAFLVATVGTVAGLRAIAVAAGRRRV